MTEKFQKLMSSNLNISISWHDTFTSLGILFVTSGICVGLQILFDGSEESPGAQGLGLIHGTVRKIQAPELKIPHMGWNSLNIRERRAKTDLFAGLSEHPYVYFVHSYHAVPEDSSVITATTEYGETLTAAVAQGNLQATQFHPEKSGDVGLQILRNFING